MHITYGGIEAGGTKFVCAVGRGPEQVVARTEFSTTTPEETLGRAAAFLRQHTGLRAIGIGAFGPIDLHRDSPTYGFITTTPKAGWKNVDIVGAISRATGVEAIGFDTDANAAAMGEFRWGSAQGLETFLYITVGTGIGGGGMVNGRLLHGLVHPEMGHIRIPHDLHGDPFPGACDVHGNCLEGLASGKAVEIRWGARGESLPEGHAAWELEAEYLAFGVVNWICTLSPQRIILGGGLMRRTDMGLVRRRVRELLNGYVQAPEILEDLEHYLVLPALGPDAGVLGAMALAEEETRSAMTQRQ